jgi:hypothetical protein
MRPTSEPARAAVLRAIAVLAVLLAAAPTRAWSQGTAPAGEVDQAVVHVVVLNRSEGRLLRRGTAFHVGGGLFYTNAHIVRRAIPSGYTEWRLAAAGAAMAPDTWLGPAAIACVHPFWRDPGTTQARPFDVALLRVEAVAALPPALSLATGLPQPGVRVRIKGFPAASRGWPPVLYTSEGRVDEVDITEQVFSVRIEAGFALGGSSGSPVLTDDGRVVGIVFGGTGEGRTASSEGVAVTVPGIQSGCPPR